MSWSYFLSAEASYLSAPEDFEIPQKDVTGQGYQCEIDDCPKMATVEFDAYGDDYPDWCPFGFYCDDCAAKRLQEAGS